MNREQVKQEVARMLWEATEISELGADVVAEEILSFLDDIGYDASGELITVETVTSAIYGE